MVTVFLGHLQLSVKSWFLEDSLTTNIINKRKKNISSIIFYFLAYDGNVGFCRTTGPRVNRGAGLGVKVPCVYLFYGGK